jgi:hypothetical protein
VCFPHVRGKNLEGMHLTLISHDNSDRCDASHLTQNTPLVSGSAGVSPAIFPISTLRKNDGETPVLQLTGRLSFFLSRVDV